MHAWALNRASDRDLPVNKKRERKSHNLILIKGDGTFSQLLKFSFHFVNIIRVYCIV